MFCDHKCVFNLRNPRSELSMLVMIVWWKIFARLYAGRFLSILNLVYYVVDLWEVYPTLFLNHFSYVLDQLVTLPFIIPIGSRLFFFPQTPSGRGVSNHTHKVPCVQYTNRILMFSVIWNLIFSYLL